MPAQPQVQMLLDAIAAYDGPTTDQQTPEEARAAYVGMHALYAPGEEVGAVTDAVVPTPDGDVPVRIYRPVDAPASAGALVWLHGGGWVIGSIDTADGVARALCARAGIIVVSVGYRLAPEHRSPAAVDDCLAALRWVVDGAEGLGIDPARVAVGGDSAGGNLAAVVAQRWRSEGRPPLRHQLLVYPVIDCTASTPSYEENAEGFLLTRATMLWFIDHYVGDGDLKDPIVSPLHAEDLSGLPPATVFTAELDPLRDEGEAYAARLREAGVTVDAVRYDGQIHAFFAMLGLLDDATAAVDRAAANLRAALA